MPQVRQHFNDTASQHSDGSHVRSPDQLRFARTPEQRCSSTAIPHMAKAAVGDLHYGLNGTFRRVPRRAKPCRALPCARFALGFQKVEPAEGESPPARAPCRKCRQACVRLSSCSAGNPRIQPRMLFRPRTNNHYGGIPHTYRHANLQHNQRCSYERHLRELKKSDVEDQRNFKITYGTPCPRRTHAAGGSWRQCAVYARSGEMRAPVGTHAAMSATKSRTPRWHVVPTRAGRPTWS